MKPDLSTLRPVPWLEGTAMVLCDMLDHHTHEPVPHSPRAVLKKQIARLREMGFDGDDGDRAGVLPVREKLRRDRKGGFRDLEPISGYNEDYHIFQTTKEEA
jgi:glutamine synthetase